MASKFVRSEDLIAKLAELGIVVDTGRVRRVVLDIRPGDFPIVHIECVGDDRLLRLLQTLDGVQVVREPATIET